MKFSVIIPTYNRAYILRRAIDSVLSQTYQNFELIVVDDGSTDETQEILEDYGEKIKILTQKNRGVSAARNLGLKYSSGELISFLDSDDSWFSHKLEAQFQFFRENPEIPLVHGEEVWIRNGKRVNPKHKHKKSGGDIFEKCLSLCLISPSAVAIKKELLIEMEGFDENFIVCEDYDLWLKVTSLHEVGFIERPIVQKYGGHEDQLSNKYFAMDYWRVKSLARILRIRKEVLSVSKVQKIKDEIIYKCEILIQGYKKHENFENLKEVEELHQKFRSSL